MYRPGSSGNDVGVEAGVPEVGDRLDRRRVVVREGVDEGLLRCCRIVDAEGPTGHHVGGLADDRSAEAVVGVERVERDRQRQAVVGDHRQLGGQLVEGVGGVERDAGGLLVAEPLEQRTGLGIERGGVRLLVDRRDVGAVGADHDRRCRSRRLRRPRPQAW